MSLLNPVHGSASYCITARIGPVIAISIKLLPPLLPPSSTPSLHSRSIAPPPKLTQHLSHPLSSCNSLSPPRTSGRPGIHTLQSIPFRLAPLFHVGSARQVAKTCLTNNTIAPLRRGRADATAVGYTPYLVPPNAIPSLFEKATLHCKQALSTDSDYGSHVVDKKEADRTDRKQGHW